MTGYIVRRIALMFPVALLTSVLLFVLMNLTPGDPIVTQLGEQPTPETRDALRRQLGLDDPMPVRFALWLGRVMQGDLGKSLRNGAPVQEEILQRLPASIELGAAAILISVLVAVPVGVLAAVFHRTPVGPIATAFSQIGIALPNFVVAYLLIYLFALQLRWLPPGSYVPFVEDPLANLQRLVLPAITLSLFGMATHTRLIRSGLMDVMNEDYIRTARAKGLSEKSVVWRHALRNALIPTVTLLGLQIGLIIEGAFITEYVFSWPGIGRLAVQGLSARDYPIVQGVVLFSVFAFLFVSLVVDLAYAYLDPRISYRARR